MTRQPTRTCVQGVISDRVGHQSSAAFLVPHGLHARALRQVGDVALPAAERVVARQQHQPPMPVVAPGRGGVRDAEGRTAW